MISISAITSVVTLVPRIIDAVRTAEQYIRGRGRGEEKKKAATETVIEQIQEYVESLKSLDIPDFRTIKWWKLVLSGKEFTTLVGNVVDSVVALMNFLSKFDDVKADAPQDPKLVN